ncbi:MAG: DoxX family protein [Henriciella sp.]|nr:DoxX family protein [Henriciella sp.]
MPNASSPIMVTIGRCLLGLYFLLPGIAKFTAWDYHIAEMQSHGVPLTAPLLAFAGVSSIIGAFLLFTNRYVRIVALGFVLYILLVNVLLHNFWALDGDEAARETQNFVKNLGILAGLLILAGYSKMRWPSVSGLMKSDSAE